MAADEASGEETRKERLTVYEALQFDDALYRRFTAVHEAGHAVVRSGNG